MTPPKKVMLKNILQPQACIFSDKFAVMLSAVCYYSPFPTTTLYLLDVYQHIYYKQSNLWYLEETLCSPLRKIKSHNKIRCHFHLSKTETRHINEQFPGNMEDYSWWLIFSFGPRVAVSAVNTQFGQKRK